MTSKDFDVHIDGWIQQNNAKREPGQPECVNHYLNALALATIGKYEPAVQLLTTAKNQMQPLFCKDNFMWERLYYSVLGLLATSLDYLGRIEASEQAFLEAMK